VVRGARIVGEVLPLIGHAVEIRAPDPARYAGQQCIQIKAAVPSELNVSLNNSRGPMAIPRLAKILVLCVSECLDGNGDPHDNCASGDVDIAQSSSHSVYCGRIQQLTTSRQQETKSFVLPSMTIQQPQETHLRHGKFHT